MDCLLMALMPKNRLACKVSLATGLRISDVLGIKTHQLSAEKMTVRELKTGKTRRFTMPKKLKDELRQISGQIYVFENRYDYTRPKSREGVYKDVRRISEALRLGKGVAPHSMRKTFAVEKFRATGDLKKVQSLLNHSSEAVTMLYALADVLKQRKKSKS
jgi:integrase